jgi:hypothetical protein
MSQEFAAAQKVPRPVARLQLAFAAAIDHMGGSTDASARPVGQRELPLFKRVVPHPRVL